MKTKGKAWQLVVTVLLIAAFVYTAFFGVAVKYGDVTKTYIKGAQDIRFGVDIKGGVNVTFAPSDNYDATDDQLDAAQLVIENRLVGLNVTDYELYVDYDSDRLILEFPWQSGETDFDPEAAIEEIGSTAYLTFRKGSSADGELILDGSMIESAAAQYGPVSNGGASEYFVSLKFTDDGAKAFGDATTKLAASGGTISIWLDDENVSTATVNTAITDGSAIITSSASNPFTQEQVVKMARQINSGALPFALTVDSYSTVSPSLGENSLSAMVLAGVIAYSTGNGVKDEDEEAARMLLSGCGSVYKVAESGMNAVSAISGCGPAYMFTALDALADAGVAMGLSRKTALGLAAETMRGASLMLERTGKHPMALRDEVTSPGGTTIAALNALDECGFRNAWIQAVKSAVRRAEEMEEH